MSITLQQLIDQAVSLASRNDSLSSAISAEMVTEDMLEIVFGDLATDMARSPATRSLLRRTKTLTFVGGEVAVPDDVLTEHMADSNLLDPDDPTKLYSFTSSWERFIQNSEQRLGYYSVEGESTLHVTEPGTAYDPAGGPDIELLLTVPCAPAVPAAATDPIAIREELIGDLIARLARALLPPQ
jgi:hypothetical protein